MELLDTCDVHLIFLRPGIFTELRLKKKYQTPRSLLSPGSPPEFLNWTAENPENSTNMNKKLADSALLKLYLNIQDRSTTDIPEHDSSIKMELPNTEVKVGNLPAEHDTSSAPTAKESDFTQESLLELLSNPLSLKAQCIQKMMELAIISQLSTLFMTCLDSLSWNENKRFPCSLMLPQTLATKHHVAELEDYSAPTEKLDISGKEEIVLYGNIKVTGRYVIVG